MEKQIFDELPELILDLGTGFYNVHFNIKEIEIDDVNENEENIKVNKFECDVVRTNDLSYGGLINLLIRNQYTIDAELSLHRQRNVKIAEFEAYNDYCEACKESVRSVLNITR